MFLSNSRVNQKWTHLPFGSEIDYKLVCKTGGQRDNRPDLGYNTFHTFDSAAH